ncbi:helix-turn-helix domain-containing protein [Acidovorax sp. JG5]|uniref:transcriptional regulator n=1 Tax=Acidovorax sp. JG5 TaxID=2822718 RepID=UPI001B33196B|nr:Cro/CI family transcriptional regulator [Acidovorax sp. JG5]MBP3980849.1 helix-turn-helix domain-containing protein [Acidovorax sp. JG5]
MDLKTYLKTHKQVELARVLGVTQGAVHQWANGLTAVAIERCVPIERATDGAVTRRDLRPNDWFDIWPELADMKKQPAAFTHQAQVAINSEAKEATHA